MPFCLLKESLLLVVNLCRPHSDNVGCLLATKKCLDAVTSKEGVEPWPAPWVMEGVGACLAPYANIGKPIMNYIILLMNSFVITNL